MENHTHHVINTGGSRQKRPVKSEIWPESATATGDGNLVHRLEIMEKWLTTISEQNSKGAEYLNELRRAAQRCVLLMERKRLLGENISPNVLARERDRAKDMVDKAQKSLCRSKVHRQSWFPALSKRLKHQHGISQNQFTRWLGKAVVSGDQAQLPRILRVPAAKLRRLVGPQPPHPITLPGGARGKRTSMVGSPRDGGSIEKSSSSRSSIIMGSSGIIAAPSSHASRRSCVGTRDCHSPASNGEIMAPTSLSVSCGVSPTVSRESYEGSDDDARQAAASRIAAAAQAAASTAMRRGMGGQGAVMATPRDFCHPVDGHRKLVGASISQDASLRLQLYSLSSGSKRDHQSGMLPRHVQARARIAERMKSTAGPPFGESISASALPRQVKTGELHSAGSTFVLTTLLPVSGVQRAQSMPATSRPRQDVAAMSSCLDMATARRHEEPGSLPAGLLTPPVGSTASLQLPPVVATARLVMPQGGAKAGLVTSPVGPTAGSMPAMVAPVQRGGHSMRSMVAPMQGAEHAIPSSLRDSGSKPPLDTVTQTSAAGAKVQETDLTTQAASPPMEPLRAAGESPEYGNDWFSLSRLPMASADSKSVRSGAGSFHEEEAGAPSGRWSSCSLDGPGPGAFFPQSTGSEAGSATGANISVDDDAIPGLWAEVATAPQQSAGHGGFEAIPAAASSSCAAPASGAEIPLMSAQPPLASHRPESADSFALASFASSSSSSEASGSSSGELSPSHSPALGAPWHPTHPNTDGSRSSPDFERFADYSSSQLLGRVDALTGGAGVSSEAVVQQVPLARRAGGTVGEIQVGIAIGSKRSRDETGDSGLSGAGAVTGDFGLEQEASVVRKRPRH